MQSRPKTKAILLAEDDPDDIYLISEAIDECQLEARVFLVQNGEELVDFLKRQGKYSTDEEWTHPDLILLDLNMPRKDGREALQEIKANPELRSIPVVVLTTSNAEEDLNRAYALGAAGFITKPVSFSGLRETMCRIGAYWLATVSLPDEAAQADETKKEER